MTDKIVTRSFIFGDEKEAEWPPRYGTGKGGHWYWDKEQGKLIEGYPPATQKFDKAPFVIGDTIEKYYHPGTQRVTESRSELKQFDQACGTITTDKMQPASSSRQKAVMEGLKKDRREALFKSVAQVDNGTAPLSEETRQMCERQNEILAAALPGLDPFNAIGKVTNDKGRRYRKSRKRKSS